LQPYFFLPLHARPLWFAAAQCGWVSVLHETDSVVKSNVGLHVIMVKDSQPHSVDRDDGGFDFGVEAHNLAFVDVGVQQPSKIRVEPVQQRPEKLLCVERGKARNV
jgi:hypothetical protein